MGGGGGGPTLKFGLGYDFSELAEGDGILGFFDGVSPIKELTSKALRGSG